MDSRVAELEAIVGTLIQDQDARTKALGLLKMLDQASRRSSFKLDHSTREIRSLQSLLKAVSEDFEEKVEELELKSAELGKAELAAQRASQAKSEFLANMSHEIRTPLHGVIGMLGLAASADESAEQAECLAAARSSAEMLKNVLDDILDLSKIESGKLEIEPLQIDVVAVARDCLRTFRAQAQQKGLEIVLEEGRGLPPVLVGDPVRLRQVIANLVGNAIKFTERGGIVVAAGVESTGEEVVVRFSVADTGIGISKSKQALIFDPFQQADASTTRTYGGTGLGLTISARLVELMGGRMWVESEEGKGSRFFFTARFCLPSRTKSPVARPKNDTQDRAGAGRRLRVLLAEDNPVNQKLATRLLERNGHFVKVARDGEEAVDYAAAEAFDLILMDVHMPKMDGYMATRRIRECESAAHRIPIIAMTACAMKGDREKCLDAGMDAYLPKPIDIDLFLAVTGKMVASK